jgi:predicted PurR-regulated permease PerM
LPVYYHLLAAMFACIALQAVVLAARLVRSRHSSSLRAVRTGMCLYVALFVPYAVLQATTLVKLAALSDRSNGSLDRDAAQISSSAAFAAFFGLGFSGKVALVQMWTHVARQHSSGGCEAPHVLHRTLISTYNAFVYAVAVIVLVYVTGFAALTHMYINSVE